MPPPIQTPPANAQKSYDSGMKAFRKGDLLAAEKFFAEAIASYETSPEFWLKLGLVWSKMNRHGEAIEAYSMSLALDPTSSDASYNLGLAHIALGQDDVGLSHLQNSFKLNPTDDLADQLGNYFFTIRDYKSTAYYLLTLYNRKKGVLKEETLHRLAHSLYSNGDFAKALDITIGLVKKHPKQRKYTDLIVDLYRRTTHISFNQDAKSILEMIIKEEKANFIFLRNPWISLFLLDPYFAPLRSFTSSVPSSSDIPKLTAILKSDFLCLGLQKSLAVSAGVETIFTNIRRGLLLEWENSASWPDTLFKFLASLAVACWYNDFVYFETPEEKEQITKLQASVVEQLKSPPTDEKEKIAFSLRLALLACYVPLCDFCKDESLPSVSKKLQHDFMPLLTAQLLYPLEEKKLLPTIPYFTSIDDEISLLVQAMYTARPYPRWISTSTKENPSATNSTQPVTTVLIAGCGTGHEPAIYSKSIPNPRITAVDLSPTSIAYGKRMAARLGIDKNIEFFLGDLMKIQEMGKKFDFVASSGVLHHLKDPEKGLSAILGALKEDGRLSISLYSEHARQQVLGAAWEYIRQKGYTSSTDDIRQFRKDVMEMTPDNPVTRCTSAGDFFFLAECNDLLFHIQEHRYTPRMIWEMADRHGIEPIHVSMTPERNKAFQELFPGESPLNPDLLEKFEEAHPKAFIEMFKIFFRWKNNASPHPLDPLIFGGNL